MRRRQPLRVSGERGLAIVEMAFILPIFLFVTLGLVEFSRAWLTVNTMNHATREAVRLAVTTANLTANNPAVDNKAKTLLANANITGATVTNTAPTGAPLQVTVTTTLLFRYLGVSGTLLGYTGFASPITLTSTATMRYER